MRTSDVSRLFVSYSSRLPFFFPVLFAITVTAPAEMIPRFLPQPSLFISNQVPDPCCSGCPFYASVTASSPSFFQFSFSIDPHPTL